MIGLLILVFYLFLFRTTEGFSVGGTPTDVEMTIKTATDALYGNLNITTYKPNYINLTTELIKWADYSMMMTLTDGKFTADDMSTVRNFNELYNFKQNMIDFNKSVSSFS